MDNFYRSEQRRFSRRAFLGRAGLLAGAAAASPLILACSPGARQSRTGPTSTPAAKAVRGGTLALRTSTDASVLDYAFSHDVVSTFALSNCVEPLLTVDTQSQTAGLLAASWENPDAQTYIFHLRPGVTFQDGTAFNADAVEFSLNRTRNDKTAYHYADLTSVTTIEKPDPLTVKVGLGAPFAPFLYKLTDNAGRVISPAAAAKLRDKLKTDLTGQGSGPFTFVEWKPDDHLTVASNARYWGKDGSGGALPYLDRLTVRPIPDRTVALASLKNGEIDGFQPNSIDWPAPQDIPAITADPTLSVKLAPGMNYYYIVFNQAREPFNNKALRQAVSYAVDRGSIAKDFWRGSVQPLDVIFSPSTWAADPTYHPYLNRDVAKARQLMAQAGKAGGFAFDYLILAGDPTSEQLAELIKDQLSEAGITLNIKPLANAALLPAASASDHQAAFLGATTGYDPDDWVYNFFSSKGSSIARSNYSNADVDRLLEEGRTTLDTAKRKPLYQQAQKQIVDDAVVCVLYGKSNFSLNTAKVQNAPIGATPAVGVSQVWKTS